MSKLAYVGPRGHARVTFFISEIHTGTVSQHLHIQRLLNPIPKKKIKCELREWMLSSSTEEKE
jgi:alpha-D-ribose 1-methylphosphonate 5-triphosphate synthase subunit PhnI